MFNIAIHLAALKLYTHALHHNTTGLGFFADHAAAGEFYEAHDEAFDSVVERILGQNVAVDHYKLADEANKVFQNTSNSRDSFETLLALEKELCELIKTEIGAGEQSQGTINLLAGIADASEVRQYKISRRIIQ